MFEERWTDSLCTKPQDVLPWKTTPRHLSRTAASPNLILTQVPTTLTNQTLMQVPSFVLPSPRPHVPLRRRRRRRLRNSPVCALDPTHHRTSPSATTTSHPRLHFLKLSLLLSDVHFRVQTHHTHPSLHPPLTSISTLSASLLTPPPPPQSTIRGALWDLRAALEPFPVTRFTRESLELARSCALHVPQMMQPADVHALSVETRLLSELKQLRAMVVRFVTSLPEGCDTRDVMIMAAELGIDEYRVRGKTRLWKAVAEIIDHRLPQEVIHSAERVKNTLSDSLALDLRVSPVGEAMLLRPRVMDIPNFAVVNERFLRGGQPNSAGVEWLRQYGVSVVVDLRGSDRENQWIPRCRVLKGLNGDMSFCNIPIEDFCTPSFGQVEEYLGLVQRIFARDGVMFVHCKAGIGRTGTLVACWRVSRGVDVEEALAMEHLYSEGGGGLRQEAFVREFARRWKER